MALGFKSATNNIEHLPLVVVSLRYGMPLAHSLPKLGC